MSTLDEQPMTPDRPYGDAAVIDASRADPERTDAGVFGTISRMLADPLPSRLRATLYRILPTLAGVRLDRDAVDATGRHGVAFTLDDDPYRNVIVLDPRTYRYLGNYVYAIRDYQRSDNEGLLKKGTYLTSIAQLAQGIVDRPGQRP